ALIHFQKASSTVVVGLVPLWALGRPRRVRARVTELVGTVRWRAMVRSPYPAWRSSAMSARTVGVVIRQPPPRPGGPGYRWPRTQRARPAAAARRWLSAGTASTRCRGTDGRRGIPEGRRPRRGAGGASPGRRGRRP